jgi:hypothetical protein
MTQQIPGIPEGWELVRVGVPDSDDWLVGHEGNPVAHAMLKRPLKLRQYAIIRKIEKPARYRQFANAEEFKPHRDRWWTWKDDRSNTFPPAGYGKLGHHSQSWSDSFDRKVFDDGTPFGVKIDE